VRTLLTYPYVITFLAKFTIVDMNVVQSVFVLSTRDIRYRHKVVTIGGKLWRMSCKKNVVTLVFNISLY